MEEQEVEDIVNKEEEIEPEKWWKGPLKYILAIFLILIVVVWVVPHYYIDVDPEPDNIPKIEDVLPKNIELTNQNYSLKTTSDFINFVKPNDPVIRQIAAKISTASCTSGNKVCDAKALYYFVRDNIKYIADPVDFEYVEDPKEVLVTKGGDCESGTLVLASMLISVGIETDLVFIPGHAFLRIKLDEAKGRYKMDGYVYLDWTCSSCGFGEIPYQNVKVEKRFLSLR